MLPSSLWEPKGEDEELVIHVRGGDVFGASGHQGDLASTVVRTNERPADAEASVNPYFAQPPLAFYRMILRAEDWRNVRVIAEDLSNPVVSALLEECPNICYEKRDLASDVAGLLNARNLVGGYGTFAITWALLNERLQKLFTPRLPAIALGRIGPDSLDRVTIRSFEFTNYIRLGNWRATDAQRRLMLELAEHDIVER
jgi:hypothetical protein